MNKNDLFPFIRNNYYKGKQLTARDFSDEQKYQADKLRALREYVCGAGVVSGLDVVAVDDTTYSVESGYAFDGNGRDIIVGTPVLKSIDATEGFSEIDLNKSVFLCLEYAETPHEAVSPLYDSSRKEYNRTKEGYRLFLTNSRPSDADQLSMIQTTSVLYSDDDVRITMTVPKFVKLNEKLVVSVTVEKLGLNKSLSADIKIEHDGFTGNEGGSSMLSYYNATEVYDAHTEQIILTPLRTSLGLSTIRVPDGAVCITAGEMPISVPAAVDVVTEIIEEDVEDRIKREFFHRSAEDFADCSEGIYLAEMLFSQSMGKVRIEKIAPLPFRQYVFSSRLSYLLNSLPKQPEPETARLSAGAYRVEENGADSSVKVASGTESIDISSDLRGRVYYSSEIIHGLGEGSVSYSIGFESMDDFTDSDKIVVYGDPLLFDNSPYELAFPRIQHSVISYNDKGSFRVAVKLLDKVNSGSIVMHWHAVKTEEKTDSDIIEIEKVSISIKPNLVNIEPRESVSLECVIEGCDNLNCIWNVEDTNGGTISKNGIYKAPSAEGVYTVSATSVKYPTKKAVNYIIVSKRKEV